MSTGPVGEWTYLHHRGLLVVILLTVILLVLLGLIELIGRPPRPLDYGGSLDTRLVPTPPWVMRCLPGSRHLRFSDTARQPHPRRWHLTDRGMWHIYIKPATPG